MKDPSGLYLQDYMDFVAQEAAENAFAQMINEQMDKTFEMLNLVADLMHERRMEYFALQEIGSGGGSGGSTTPQATPLNPNPTDEEVSKGEEGNNPTNATADNAQSTGGQQNDDGVNWDINNDGKMSDSE